MKSVLNTLALLELIAAHQPVSLGELCGWVEQPKSSMQRALSTLKDAGWIKPSDVEGKPRWVLSNRFLSLTGSNHLVARLSQLAKPALVQLRDNCNETVFLSTFDYDHMTVIDCIDSTHAVRLVGAVGGSIPAFMSSTGKACLARLPEDHLIKILKGKTDRIPQGIAQLKREINEIRQQGYAIIRGEWSQELTHIGAAIVDALGHPIGGIGIAIPNHRQHDVFNDALIKQVVEACENISRSLAREST
ncbi:Transcriptional repressor IclR [BD1-7 clade bacterium]|uniref:Transcriptional repressor IclR n=1 Tax=BD1-7 clade bacterium TaxID=2029982 RepID=A0A5S9PM93_9GAMM|nr:Transcriptional repressor IclR [BD1-7 clade bacterium]